MDAASIAPAQTTASAIKAPQHMQALARANRVRLARAELKRSIARGDLEAADVIRDCPWETESMTLAELLTSQRRWGRTRARKFLLGSPSTRTSASAPSPPASASCSATELATREVVLV